MCAYIRNDEPTYDAAQICLNGHVVNSNAGRFPTFNQSFCSRCGAKTITACGQCDAKIRGHLVDSFATSEIDVPAFCYACGKPYPWVGTAVDAAKDLADELDELDPEQREALKGAIDDLVRDTPRTQVAIVRVKKLLPVAGRTAAEAMKKLLIDVVTEAAKRQLWP